MSLNFRKAKTGVLASELATGYLDDFLIISFGLNDSSSHFVEVVVEDLLQDIESCEYLVKEDLKKPVMVFENGVGY